MKFLKLFPILFLINIAFAQQTIKDLTVNDFKVENVKQGSKPCPLMTETQRNAITSPQNGRCIYNTTAGKLNIYNSTAGIWKAAGGGVDAWVTAFNYSVDDLVIQSSKIYQALVAHTSSVFATDLAASRWIEISAMPNLTGDVTSVGSVTSYNTVVPISKGGTGNTTGNATTVTTNANMTGAVTSVGNATSLGSFTSVNLATALTDKTGTGSAVFSTSPTLVTPEIGAATGTSLALGGTINANAVADFQSTTKAFIAPRMTTAQKNAIPSPVAGMEVFDTTIGAKSFYNGTQWISNLSIAGDTVYSAQLASTSGAISNQTGSWLASCSRSGTNTGIITCIPVAGKFSSTPNCGGSVNVASSDQSTVMYNYGASTATSLVFHTATPTTTAASAATLTNAALGVWCQKTGADYANSSSSGILSSNADYGPIPVTYTLTNAGNATVTGTVSRTGGRANFKGLITIGATPPTGTITLNVPSIYATSSGNFKLGIASAFSGSVGFVNAGIFSQTTTSYSFAGGGSSAWNATVPSTWTSVANNYIEFNFQADVTGWTQSPIAIIPLAETVKIPGTSQNETFKIHFGQTDAYTTCTTGSCFRVGPTGMTLPTVTYSSTGIYSLAGFPRTYSSIFCKGSGFTAGTGSSVVVPVYCTNCSGLNITFINTITGGNLNTRGEIECTGTY